MEPDYHLGGLQLCREYFQKLFLQKMPGKLHEPLDDPETTLHSAITTTEQTLILGNPERKKL
eukprot:15366892-Ditylum_brightwellii.AAC.1